MKKSIFVLFYLVFLGSSLWAGDSINHSRKWVMGMPQHLFKNGIRIEIDRELGQPERWITLSPVIYYRGKEANYWLTSTSGFESMQGGGLSIFYRYFPGALSRKFNLYLMTGGGYEFISFKVGGIRWLTIEDGGLEYYIMDKSGFFNSHLHTLDIRAALGFKWVIANHFAIDFFAGPKIGYSFKTRGNKSIFAYYDGYSYMYEKNGIGVAAGVRIGVGW